VVVYGAVAKDNTSPDKIREMRPDYLLNSVLGAGPRRWPAMNWTETTTWGGKALSRAGTGDSGTYTDWTVTNGPLPCGFDKLHCQSVVDVEFSHGIGIQAR
jgi:hypothetical protein